MVALYFSRDPSSLVLFRTADDTGKMTEFRTAEDACRWHHGSRDVACRESVRLLQNTILAMAGLVFQSI